jgi:hypothetical protein
MPDDGGPELYDDAFWIRVDRWAKVIGLGGPEAVARASEPPGGI